MVMCEYVAEADGKGGGGGLCPFLLPSPVGIKGLWILGCGRVDEGIILV